MYNYDSVEHNPPAPVILIEIRRPDRTEHHLKEKALIDTGASKSCIPINIIDALLLTQTGEVDVTGFTETQTERRTTYGAKIKLDYFFDDVIDVIELPENTESIIGRDILNKLNISLKGKNQKFEMSIPK